MTSNVKSKLLFMCESKIFCYKRNKNLSPMQLFTGNDKKMPLTKQMNQEGGRQFQKMREPTQEECERDPQDDDCPRSVP